MQCCAGCNAGCRNLHTQFSYALSLIIVFGTLNLHKYSLDKLFYNEISLRRNNMIKSKGRNQYEFKFC